jgi:hypothetical protein
MDSDGCRCESGLQLAICERVYPATKSTHKRIPEGRVVVCLDAEVDSEVTKYALSLILYGACDSRKVNRFLGYDTAHDDYHQKAYGNCHRHACGTCESYSPCDYLTVAAVFFSEVDHEISQRGFRRG